MESENRSLVGRRDQLWALGFFLALLVLYGRNHCRSFGAGDSAQHVLSALTWGVSRPPGYPLYVMLAHFFSRLPLRDPASLVNLLSGVLHAAASAIFFLILRRWRLNLAAALTATAALSLSPLYWYYSEVAEVRALNDFLALTAAYISWGETKTRELKEGVLLGICLGLGLGHHPTFILIFPAVLYSFSRRRVPGKVWAAMIAALSVALIAPYLILWLRLRWGAPPIYNPDAVRAASDIRDLFLRRKTGGFLSFAAGVPGLAEKSFDAARLLEHAYWFGRLALSDLLLPGILLAVLGSLSLWRGERRVLNFWLLWVLGSLLPVLIVASQEVRFGDVDYLRAIVLRFFLLPMIGLFALSGFGADWLLARARRELGWALVAVSVLCPLFWRPIDLGASGPLRAYALDILASSGPGDMILLTSDEANFSLLYMDLIEHRTEDRVFLFPGLFAYEPYIQRLSLRHPNLKLPRDSKGLSRSVARWMAANPDRPMEGEPTMRDSLVKVSAACYPQGILVRLGQHFPPAQESARQARQFLEHSAVEKLPGWGLRPWTQEVYLLKAYAMSLEFYGSFLRRPEDTLLAERARRDFLALIAVR